MERPIKRRIKRKKKVESDLFNVEDIAIEAAKKASEEAEKAVASIPKIKKKRRTKKEKAEAVMMGGEDKPSTKKTRRTKKQMAEVRKTAKPKKTRRTKKQMAEAKASAPAKEVKKRRTKKEKKEAETMGGEDTLMLAKPAKKTRAKKGEPKKPRKSRAGIRRPEDVARIRSKKELPELVSGAEADFMEAVKILSIPMSEIPNLDGYKQRLLDAYGKNSLKWKTLDIYALRFKSPAKWDEALGKLNMYDVYRFQGQFIEGEGPEEDRKFLPNLLVGRTNRTTITKLFINDEGEVDDMMKDELVRTLPYSSGTFGRDARVLDQTAQSQDDTFTSVVVMTQPLIPLAGGVIGLEYFAQSPLPMGYATYYRTDPENKPEVAKSGKDITIKRNRLGRSRDLPVRKQSYWGGYWKKLKERKPDLPEPWEVAQQRQIEQAGLIVIQPQYNKVLVKRRAWVQLVDGDAGQIIIDMLDAWDTVGDNDYRRVPMERLRELEADY